MESAEAVFRATPEELLAVDGITKALVEKLSDKQMDEALKILDFCHRRHITLLPFDSPEYPKRLRRLPDFPLLLYVKGHLPAIDHLVCIATVGTRSVTEYGGTNAYLLARDLARAGAVVISGMANGVDSFCHRGALDALGTTVAVLGSGIDVIYPKNNAELYEEIVRTGAVVTEYRPGTPPAGYNFPLRNRIISGLCLGTLVVEADRKSGAMITARTAQMQGRDIFALPGNVGEMNSLGTNDLIKEGARMVTGALDILEEYELIFPEVLHTERLLRPLRQMNIADTRGILRVASPRRILVDDRPEDQKPPLPAEKSEKAGKEPKKKEAGSTPGKTKSKDKKEPAPLKKATPPDNVSETEKQVLAAMPQGHSVTGDEIARCGIPISKVLVALTTLEIKGLVVSLPGGSYMKNM